jgi:hypothetical protein
MGGWGAWFPSWGWSLALVALTIAVHVSGVVLLGLWIERFEIRLRRRGRSYLDSRTGTIGVIIGIALSLAVFHAIEAMIWAVAYVWLGAMRSPAGAILYSVDSMTTRGASGLSLGPQWSLLGAIEAGDGMLLFGISTAFLFYVMLHLWKSDSELRRA